MHLALLLFRNQHTAVLGPKVLKGGNEDTFPDLLDSPDEIKHFSHGASMLVDIPASPTASKASWNREEGQLKNLAKQHLAQKTAAIANSATA